MKDVDRHREEKRAAADDAKNEAFEKEADSLFLLQNHFIKIGIAELSVKGKYLRVNNTLCDILERSEEELLMLNVADVTYEDDLPESIEAVKKVLSLKGPVSIDKRYKTKTGDLIWVNTTLSLLLHEGTKPPTILAVTVDNAQRRIAEEARRKSEEEFRLFVMTSFDSLYKMSADWKEMLSLNGMGLLHSTESPIKDWMDKYIPFSEQPVVKQKIEEAIRNKIPFALEHRVMRADGLEGWVFSRAIPVMEKNGTIREWLGAATDITLRKRSEQQQQDLLRAKDDFIGIVGHELRTPVTSIKIFAELLEELYKRGQIAESAPVIQKLNGQVERLSGLIKNLIEATKISEHALLLRKELIKPDKLIAEQVEDLQRIYPLHKIFFKACALPEINIDKDRIIEVIINMISNAAKYSPEGSEITVEALPEKQAIKVIIKDQGAGIPAHLQEKIFERFFRGNNTTQNANAGLGLGLYISAGIIRQHGGIIGVKSEEGKGSAFWFSLPVPGME